jgi:hypothetical protein
MYTRGRAVQIRAGGSLRGRRAGRARREPVFRARRRAGRRGVELLRRAPLLDDQSGDASAVTRDYMLERHTDAAPLLSVWGGKITTFRKLAEEEEWASSSDDVLWRRSKLGLHYSRAQCDAVDAAFNGVGRAVLDAAG